VSSKELRHVHGKKCLRKFVHVFLSPWFVTSYTTTTMSGIQFLLVSPAFKCDNWQWTFKVVYSDFTKEDLVHIGLGLQAPSSSECNCCPLLLSTVESRTINQNDIFGYSRYIREIKTSFPL